MFRKLLGILKCFLFISMYIRTYYLYCYIPFTLITIFIIITLLMINDNIRSTKLDINSRYIYSVSLLFTIILSSITTYFTRGFGAHIYLLFPLPEIFQLQGKRLKTIFSLHCLSYLSLLISHLGIPHNFNILSIETSIIVNYIFVSVTIYSLNKVGTEKQEINKLNSNLQLANIKLQQYASEVEELTISKERCLMAQELHDSVGHTLMALTMHLEFAKKMYYSKPEEVLKVLNKSEDIARSSIISLREAVSLLKEEKEIESFTASINNIINNFYLINNIKIHFNTNENLDNLSPIITSALYKTIKESITNSIKHGQATEIYIIASMENDNINLILSDNGIGCDKITKSNGLLGIEDRIASINGSVKYFSDNNLGFGIDISIPILMGEIQE